jgi:hypothetical protein
MYVVVFSFIFALTALASGIAVIGNGKAYRFTKMDIMRGRRNAVLYIYGTASTMFSLVHSVVIGGYLMHPRWGYSPAVQIWFGTQIAMSILLMAASAYLFRSLYKNLCGGAENLW